MRETKLESNGDKLILKKSGNGVEKSRKPHINLAGSRTRRETDKVAESKGWYNREIKPKESKSEEGYVALVVEGHLALG
jgi:hypothetical protein